MKKSFVLLMIGLLALSCNQKTSESTSENEIIEYPKSDIKLNSFNHSQALGQLGLSALNIGQPIPELYTVTPSGTELNKEVFRTESASFDVIYFKKDGKNLIRFYPDIDKMFMITFLDPAAVPDKMIGPHHVLADLKATYPDVELQKAFDGRILARTKDGVFRLDAQDVKVNEVPEGTRILEITVQGV